MVPPPLHEISPVRFLKLGFALITNKRSASRLKSSRTDFQALYGVTPESCARIFTDLRTEDLGEAALTQHKPRYFLMTLNWLRTYKTEPELKLMFDRGADTARTWCWKYTRALQALKAKKIVWPWLGNDSLPEFTFILSVDGTHCPINEPRMAPSKKWYSKKFNGAGVSYEVAISIFTNQVVWTNGPFPASTNDLTIFRMPNGLKSKMPAGKRGIADKGYRGEPNVLSIKSEYDLDYVADFKRDVRARQETFNSRLKAFKILSHCFRHELEMHQAAFEAVCVICQYNMENGQPLFSI